MLPETIRDKLNTAIVLGFTVAIVLALVYTANWLIETVEGATKDPNAYTKIGRSYEK